MSNPPTIRRFFDKPVAAAFAGLILLTLVFFWFEGGNLRLAIPLVFIKLIGLAASIVLVMGKLEHPFFFRICPKGEKLSCFAVINSPAAALFGRIHTADLGTLYFFNGLILMVFSAPHPYFFYYVYLLALLNLATLPYTIFSVTYQALVVKKWCALCLIVQLVFWLEFIFFLKFLRTGFPPFSVEDFYLPLWTFALPTLLWFICRPRVEELLKRRKST